MSDIAFLLPALIVVWLSCALLSFMSGVAAGRPKGRWLLVSLLLGPVGLIVALFVRATPGTRPEAPVKKYREEDFFRRTPPFAYEIRHLKKEGRLQEAADLLWVLMEEVEAKARPSGRQVPQWYYRQLASIYRRQKKPKQEERILKRGGLA